MGLDLIVAAKILDRSQRWKLVWNSNSSNGRHKIFKTYFQR